MYILGHQNIRIVLTQPNITLFSNWSTDELQLILWTSAHWPNNNAPADFSRTVMGSVTLSGSYVRSGDSLTTAKI